MRRHFAIDGCSQVGMISRIGTDALFLSCLACVHHSIQRTLSTFAFVTIRESLTLVLSSIAEGLPSDFWIVDLRGAALQLGEIDGSEADLGEEVLDGVFSKFCIGK